MTMREEESMVFDMEETIDIEKEISIVEDIVHDRDSLSERDFIAIENLLQEVKRLRSESLRLRFQDIPYLHGTIKGYKDILGEERAENDKLKRMLTSRIKYTQELEKDLFEGCSQYIVSKKKIEEYKNRFIEDSKNEKVFMTQSSQINASLISFCNELLGGETI